METNAASYQLKSLLSSTLRTNSKKSPINVEITDTKSASGIGNLLPSHGNDQNIPIAFLNKKVFASIGDSQSNFKDSGPDLEEINKLLLQKAQKKNGIEQVEDQVSDYFSPEKTANRIFNFATSFYEMHLDNHGLEDTEENRKSYSEFIGASIEEGFEGALEVLGSLPDEVSQKVEETHQIVFERLDAFVTGEETSYLQKVEKKVNEKTEELDEDKSGDLSIEETRLSKDMFAAIDQNDDQRLSIDELVQEIVKVDKTKDLSDDLIDNILNNSKSHKDIAEEALKSSNGIGFTMDFFLDNPDVAQAIISFSNNDKIGDLAEFLRENPDSVQKIIEDPNTLGHVIRSFKLETLLSKLNEGPITAEYLQNHDSELDSFFENESLIEYFNSNPESAQRLVNQNYSENTYTE